MPHEWNQKEPGINKKTKDKSLYEPLGYLILAVISIIPGLLLSYRSLISPWASFRLSRAIMSVQANHVVNYIVSAAGYRVEHLGGEIVHTALLKTLNWPPGAIILLPLGTLLLAFVYFGTAKLLSGSFFTSFCIAVYVSWYYPPQITQFNIGTYVWTNILFLSFLIFLFLWLRKQTLPSTLFIILIFISTFLHYHTTPIWIIIAIVVSYLLFKLINNNWSVVRSTSWAFPLLFIVVYLIFDTVLFGNALARFKLGAQSESLLQSTWSRIIAPLIARTPAALGPFEIATVNPRLATWTTLAILLLLTIPVAFWVLHKIYRVVLSRDKNQIAKNSSEVFIWGIILVAATHFIMYAFYGALSFRVIPFAFPLLIPLVFRGLRIRRYYEYVLVFIIAACAVIGFISYFRSLAPSTISSETGNASNLFSPGARIMSGADTYGTLSVSASEDGKVLDYAWPNSGLYASVLGLEDQIENAFDYLVVDLADNPLITIGWVFMEPMSRYLPLIEQNRSLNKIYVSEKIIIHQPVSKPLPQSIPPNILTNKRYSFNYLSMLNLLFSTLILAFLPGLAIVLIARRYSWLPDLEPPIIIAIIIGLSVCCVTLLGYITNFTPLGLNWFLPLLLILSISVLIFYIILNRHSLLPGRIWVLYLFALISSLFLWSLLSTFAAHTRFTQRANYTEFYITQDGSQSDLLSINVTNNQKQPESLSIFLEVDGARIQDLGEIYLMPQTSWVQSVSVSEELKTERLEFLLYKDDSLYRSLSILNPGGNN